MFTEIRVEDDIVKVEWGVRLSRMAGGYPTGGDYKKDHIRLGPGARKAVLRENVVHELLHKLWDKSELSNDYSDKTEEYILSSLSGWLLDTLRDNPALREFLFEDAQGYEPT